MSVDFKAKNFFYPLRLLRFHRFLEESQWYEREKLEAYQRRKLEEILRHAYETVPYYRELFDRLKLRPEDIKGPEDLDKIPPLTKETVRENGARLTARNMGRYRPVRQRTSGTSGEPVEFYLDRHANVLEFCYYWRYWSWGGYRLGRPFAELGLHAFLDTDLNADVRYSRLTRKLDLNAARLSLENLEAFVRALERHRIAFLKGPPSGLHMFAQLLESEGYDVGLEAVFTTGESPEGSPHFLLTYFA